MEDRPPEPAVSPAPRRRWGRLCWLLTTAALVQPLAVQVARWDWHAEALVHFQEPALVITLLALLAQRRRPRVALPLVLLAAFQLEPLVRYSLPNPVPSDPGSPARLRILTANVLFTNEDDQALARLVRAERPDVVGLVEFSDPWLGWLERTGLHEEYPYHVEYPMNGMGLALYLRERPLAIHPRETPWPESNPMVSATVRFAGGDVDLILVHPANPLCDRGRANCNPELNALAERVSRGASRVVFGDLNRSDGSPQFFNFLHASGLRDSRLGFGRQPSWPTWSPYRIAIDHAFLSPDLAVEDRRLCPEIGSDHFPLIVEIAPASARNPSNQSAQSSR